MNVQSRILTGLCLLLSACGSDKNKGDEVIVVARSTKQDAIQSDGNAQAGGGQPNSDGSAGKPAECTPAGGSAPQPAAVTPFTFTEAKTYCAGCHGANNAKWSTASGSEADWKAMAPQLKASVSADRMPLPAFAPADKAKFIAFLDQLTGTTTPPPPPCENPAPGGGMPTPAPTATPPVAFTFTTARALCVGCHSASAPAAVREEPYLETIEQWRREKGDIQDEVRSGAMPRGMNMSPADRQKLLDFIRTL